MIHDRVEGRHVPVERHLLIGALETFKEHVTQLLALRLELFLVERIPRGYQVVDDPDLINELVGNLQCGSKCFTSFETTAANITSV